MSHPYRTRDTKAPIWMGILLLLPITSLGQAIAVDGTPTAFRALLEVSNEFAKTVHDKKIEIRYGGSYVAVESLGKGYIEIACIEYPLRKYVDTAWAKAFPEGTAPATEYTFAQTALGVVANSKNAVSRLTHDQLRDIWSGKVTFWREVGGSGGRIKVLTSKALSGTMVSDLILNYRQWPTEVKRLSADTNVIASVMADPDAIGFVALMPDLPKDVKLLAYAVDAKTLAVQPTVENIVLELYTLVRQYKLILTDKSSPAAHDFAKFACSPEAAKVVQEWGLFPVAIRNKAEADQRLADMKAGRGIRLSVLGIETGRPALQDLAVEYVRTRAVIQSSYAAIDADVSSIGAFITGGEGLRELLLLGDKPSGRAMELHGEKWLALGVDEEGQPTGGGPDEYMIAGRTAAIIVNPANKLESLTLGQIQAIFQGDVDDWAIIGGTELTPPAGPGGRPGKLQINLFGLFPRDPASAIFEKEGVPRDKWKRVTLKKDTADALAAVSMDPHAMAFVDLSAIPTTGQSVKIVPIKFGQGEKARNIAPTAENIKNAMYPLSQRYFLYVHPKASDTAKDFASFLATCGGSEATSYADTVKAMMDTYRKHGLIPLADEAITRAAKDAMAEAAAKARAEEAAKGKRK